MNAWTPRAWPPRPPASAAGREVDDVDGGAGDLLIATRRWVATSSDATGLACGQYLIVVWPLAMGRPVARSFIVWSSQCIIVRTPAFPASSISFVNADSCCRTAAAT